MRAVSIKVARPENGTIPPSHRADVGLRSSCASAVLPISEAARLPVAVAVTVNVVVAVEVAVAAIVVDIPLRGRPRTNVLALLRLRPTATAL